MRLRNICSIEDANHYLPKFMEEFNKKFSKEPRGQFDAHRPLDSGYDLDRVLTRCEIRTLSKDLSFSFYNTKYQILEPFLINRLKNKRIEVRQKQDETIRVFYNDQELKCIPCVEYINDHVVLDSKDKLVWPPARGGHPIKHHPWKRYGYQWSLGKKLKQMEVVI